MTPRQALREAARWLREAAGGDAPACARWLLLAALDTDMAGYALAADRPMAGTARRRFDGMVARCAAGEPVQYILGCWDFAGLRLRTDRRALIPRPETEELARAALALLEGVPSPAVADVGCGTGCIGLLLAARRPDARVTLCDLSDDALALAGENAAALGLPATLLRADMARSLPGGPYDLLVSNPPYIPSGDIDALPPMVRDREPRLALDGGPDGLTAYRALARRLDDSVGPGGAMAVEVGAGQAPAVARLLSAAGGAVRIHTDLSGAARMLTARKP